MYSQDFPETRCTLVVDPEMSLRVQVACAQCPNMSRVSSEFMYMRSCTCGSIS